MGWFQTYPKREVAGYGEVSTNSLGIFGLPNGDDKLGTPDFQFTNYAPLGSSGDTLFFELQDSKSLVNQTSWVLNRHTLKFGGEARLIRTDNLQPNPGTTVWNFQPILHQSDRRCQYRLGLCKLSSRHCRGRSDIEFSRDSSSRAHPCTRCSCRTTSASTANSRSISGLRWDAPLYYTKRKIAPVSSILIKASISSSDRTASAARPGRTTGITSARALALPITSLDKTVIRGGFGIFSVGTMSSGAFGFLQSDPIFADADAGRYNTVDQITPGLRSTAFLTRRWISWAAMPYPSASTPKTIRCRTSRSGTSTSSRKSADSCSKSDMQAAKAAICITAHTT